MQADAHPVPTSPGAPAAVALTASGLTFGPETRLMRFETGTERLAVAADRNRCLALLAIAGRGPVAPSLIRHLEAASAHWERGDRAIANFRLTFAGLPRLENAGDAARLRAAAYLLDHGMTPRELLEELDIDAAPLELEKFDPNQPRVPAGQGEESGQWTRFLEWLGEPVPVYDQDTGDEVGTRSRGSAIATNPLTIIGAGAAVLVGAEAAAAAAAAATAEAATAVAAEFVPEKLTAFALRYLTPSGGRLGSASTRQQLFEIAREFVKSDEFEIFNGDGEGPEEYICGTGPAQKAAPMSISPQRGPMALR